MTTVAKKISKTNLQHMAESILDVEGGFGDLINEAFSDYEGTGYLNLTEIPDEITEAFKNWLATVEVTDYD